MIKCQQCLVFCSANDCCVISINRPFWRNEQEQGLILIGIFIELGVIEIEYELNKINIFNKIDEEPSLTGIFRPTLCFLFFFPTHPRQNSGYLHYWTMKF